MDRAYRDAELPYAPLLVRLGWYWRALGVLCGGTLAMFGAAMGLLLPLGFEGGLFVCETDLVLVGMAPIAGGLLAYGVDLARRAILVRSTDRSAFQGRLGRVRAVLGAIFGGGTLVHAFLLFSLMSFECKGSGPGVPPRVICFCAVVGLFGVFALIVSLHGLAKIGRARIAEANATGSELPQQSEAGG